MDIEGKAIGNTQPTWEQLDDNGKIERLRQVVKTQDRTIKKMTDYLNHIVGHEHMNGRMVKYINHPNTEDYGGFYHRILQGELF